MKQIDIEVYEGYKNEIYISQLKDIEFKRFKNEI
jgi:hypothetical protein